MSQGRSNQVLELRFWLPDWTFADTTTRARAVVDVTWRREVATPALFVVAEVVTSVPA